MIIKFFFNLKRLKKKGIYLKKKTEASFQNAQMDKEKPPPLIYSIFIGCLLGIKHSF